MFEFSIPLSSVPRAAGMLLLAIGLNAEAQDYPSPEPAVMTDVVRQALERELGAAPEIKSVISQMANKYSSDEGSVGRKLTADEWRESQAIQALSGYQMAKQARQHDIDSLVWCTLRGGGNSGTYMKPLIDFDDRIKLAFYTYKSSIQKYFASSKGVDLSYGPSDKITPVIIGLGEGRVIDLTIQCLNEQGRVVSTKRFNGIKLPSGRPIVELDAFRPNIGKEGYYGVSYVVAEKGQVIGRSFELKHFTNDRNANGDSDFIGETSVFDTEQRVEFLSHYAEQACRFYGDPNLDKKVITDNEVTAALNRIKPQPLPKERTRLVLNSGWTHLAYREGETAEDKQRLATWSGKGVSIKNEQLTLTQNNSELTRTFDPLDWRFFLQWKVIPAAGKTAEFALGDGKASLVTIKMDARGNITAGGSKAGRIKPGTAGELKVEVDLQYSQFSLYVDGERTLYAADLPVANEVTSFNISGGKGLAVDDIWGVEYDPAEDIRNGIFEIDTFIDEDFAVTTPVSAWQTASYDASGWTKGGELPIIVGSERNQGRDIFMRKTVKVGAFEQAFLNLDALDPGGEIFVNGKSVAKLNRRPTRLDVTRFLKKGSNLIAVKVDHVSEGFYPADGHTSKDLYFGWFAGRMSLDLTSKVHVDDVFVHTETIGGTASVRVAAELSNQSSAAFDGEAVIRFFRWYPTESSTAAAEHSVPVKLNAGQRATLSEQVSIANPLLWDYENPNLYKVTVTLVDKSGKARDDYAVTTGIRTISEEGGTFRINGKEEVLNGATWMQFPAPFTESTTWHRCCPTPWIVKGILMTQAMGGNAIRKHEATSSYSDPRFAEIGDQLGVMYIWVPTGWARKQWTDLNKNPDGSPMSLEDTVEEFTVDIRQIRNSPSIVMWEIFNEGVDSEDKDALFEAFYTAIYETDSSRFIMPLKGYYRDEPMVIKGGQIDTLGYAQPWEGLRLSPLDQLEAYENDPEYGMYAVEFAEVVGQDNWDLVKCKPWYKVHSYEWGPLVYKIDCSVDGKDRSLLISEEGRIIIGK